MTTTRTQSAWDFKPVYDLIQALKSEGNGRNHAENKSPHSSVKNIQEDRDDDSSILEGSGVSLGNFDRLWDHLGVQRDVPTPPVPHFSISTTKDNIYVDKNAYASDGAIYYPPSAKNVKYKDDDAQQDLTDIQPQSPASSQEPQLNKNQRKKRNRKLKRDAEQQAEAANGPAKRTRSDKVYGSSASAEDTDNSPPQRPQAMTPSKKKPKAKGHSKNASLSDAPLTPKPKVKNDASEQPSVNSIVPPVKPGPSAKDTKTVKVNAPSLPKSAVTPQKASVVPTATPDAIKLAVASLQNAMKTAPPQPPPPPPQTPEAKKEPNTSNTIHESLKKQWPVAKPYATLQARANGPSTPSKLSQTDIKKVPQTVNGKINGASATFTQTQPSSNNKRHEILPLINQTSLDRNWSLFMKLVTNFPEDRKHLVSPLQLSINRPVANGIHIFVDASNIMIGFMEHLKRVRGIHRFARVPHVDLNFHALALLLERRRPITKRVLAGSLPEVQAFEEARQVGYETCILDKVFKARELTERQKYFEGYTSGNGSDGNVAPPQQPKWVEQAVDEILHLKICESVIDTPTPAADAGETVESRPTMVVATGDAAEAEYSPGFLKMVERALKKGWNVEVMAFGKSVSMGYRRMQQLPMEKGGWGERFKIIELDDYAEELFGEAM